MKEATNLLEIFMASIPLCLLLNKAHLFSLTQHMLILIQLVTLMCVTCFGLYLDQPQACQYKNLTKEDTIKI